MISDIYTAQRGAGVHGAGAGSGRGGEDHQEAGGATHRHGLPVRTHAPLLILPRQADFSYDIHDQCQYLQDGCSWRRPMSGWGCCCWAARRGEPTATSGYSLHPLSTSLHHITTSHEMQDAQDAVL